MSWALHAKAKMCASSLSQEIPQWLRTDSKVYYSCPKAWQTSTCGFHLVVGGADSSGSFYFKKRIYFHLPSLNVADRG